MELYEQIQKSVGVLIDNLEPLKQAKYLETSGHINKQLHHNWVFKDSETDKIYTLKLMSNDNNIPY